MAHEQEPRHHGVDGPGPGAHTLGPHVVGRRVVVRRVLRGEVGPTGGPAMTDVLGTCRSWGRGLCEVEREDGTVVAIHLADIVSGKPVPPRPSVRLRIPAAALHRHAGAAAPGLQRERLGDWELPTSPDGTAQVTGSTVIAVGDPGVPLPDAVERVRAHYAALGSTPRALVVAGDEVESVLLGLGWRAVDTTPMDTGLVVMVASVARVLRSIGGTAVDVVSTGTDAPRVSVAAGQVGRAEAALTDADPSLVGVTRLQVDEPHRRQGIGTALVAALLDHAASRGATTAYVRVPGTGSTAVGFWEALGFLEHHRCRFLVRHPAGPPSLV